MKPTLKKITPLLVVFTVLLSSSFIDAAWTAPTGSPSASNNAPAPINVSGVNQIKQGNITARSVRAGNNMWSPRYCDENGQNCVSSLGGGMSDCVLAYRFRRNNTEGEWQAIALDGNSNVGGWSTWSVGSLNDECNGAGCGVQMQLVCGGGPLGYHWEISGWGACYDTSSGCVQSSSQNAIYNCVEDGTGTVVADANCTSPRPTATQSCSYSTDNCRCFVAGTQVTMANGSKKNIEEVNIGDRLLGKDGAVNTVLAYERPMLGERKLYSINGGEHFVTPAHPFLTTEGWKSISMDEIHRENTGLVDELAITELEVGDVLIKDDGSLEVVESIDGTDAEDQQLYNFRLTGDETYFVNGILTHTEFRSDE